MYGFSKSQTSAFIALSRPGKLAFLDIDRERASPRDYSIFEGFPSNPFQSSPGKSHENLSLSLSRLKCITCIDYLAAVHTRACYRETKSTAALIPLFSLWYMRARNTRLRDLFSKGSAAVFALLYRVRCKKTKIRITSARRRSHAGDRESIRVVHNKGARG